MVYIILFAKFVYWAHGITIQGSAYLGRRYMKKGLLKGLVLVSSLCVFFGIYIHECPLLFIAGVNGSMTIDTVIF